MWIGCENHDCCEQDPYDADLFLGVLPIAQPMSQIDVEALSKKELDENGFIRVPYGGTSDSGAADTVAPEQLFSDYPLEPSPGSMADMWYVGAGGQRIKNKGQRTILIMTREKRLRWITVQVAAVKNMLIAVSKSNACHNEVIHRKSGSFIRDENNGDKLALRRSRGTFVLDMWVVPHSMIKTGVVKYKDANGTIQRAKVDKQTTFSRQS